MASATDTSRPSPQDFGLTEKEAEVGRLLRYYPDWQVGELLGISHSTVRQYINNMNRKLDLDNRWALIRFFRDSGLE